MFEQSCTWKFTAPLFIIAENWKQFSCPSTGKWLTNSRTFLPWNATQPLKRTIIDTCNNLEESPENHTEWKTPSPKGYTLYDSIYITFLRWQYIKEEQIGSCQESRRGCGQEGRESSYKKATWGILAVMEMLTVSIS